MREECTDCLNAQYLKEQLAVLEKNTDDKITAIWLEIKDSKTQRKQHDKDIADLKTIQGVTGETVLWIKESITDIKIGLKSIATTLEKMQNKGSMTFDSLKYKVLEYCVMAVVVLVVIRLSKT